MSSKTNWTKDQLNAIRLKPKKMLVSAAAGSGKTAVLSERILERLSDTDSQSEISRFLIVTYTRLAAAELRSRIGRKLRESAAEFSAKATDDTVTAEERKNAESVAVKLSKQCARLGSANISTIHSYCATLIKRHFKEAGLPPVLNVCEAAQTNEIKVRLMDTLIESAYAGKFAPIPDFADFADHFVTGNDKSLQDKLLGLYDTAIGLPQGFKKWTQAAEMLESDTPFLKTPWGEILIKDLQRSLSYYRAGYKAAHESLQLDEVYADYIPLIDNEIAMLDAFAKVLETRDVAAIRQAYSEIVFGKAPSIKTEQKTEDGIYFTKNIRDKYKDLLKKLFNQTLPWALPPEPDGTDAPLLKEIRLKSAAMSKALISFLQEFNRLYKEEKLSMGILDFADLEQYTYKLLYTEDGEISPLAHQVSRSFDEIFVDEFQDVNPMQSMIFNALSCECNIFQVGDIKQSIYGFRGAEPDIFANCRRSYTPYTSPEAGKEDTDLPYSLTVFLSANFRSHYPIAKFANRIFDCLFYTPDDYASKEQRIPYSPDFDCLVCRRKDSYLDKNGKPATGDTPAEDMTETPRPDLPPVKVMLIETDSDNDSDSESESDDKIIDEISKEELECRVVANEIIKLTTRKENKVNGEDIAVVARSGNHIAQLSKILMDNGIVFSSGKDSKLIDTPEVSLALALLACVDNPHRDIELASALRSPYFRVDLDELIAIRRFKKGVSLYSALCKYNDKKKFEKGQRFCDFIERIRKYASGQPTSRVLWQIFKDTNFFTMIYDGGKTGSTLAATRRANLVKLHKLASDEDNVGRDGIYTFIRRFKKLSEGSNAPTASTVCDVNTVRFYTVHSSKGLEFKHCFVCGLGHDPMFNARREASSYVFCDNDLGIAFSFRDKTGIVKTESPVRKALETKMLYAQLEEELRILYVALTRAQDHLYVTATVNNVEKMLNETKLAARINDPEVYSGQTCIEWIFTALQNPALHNSVFLPPEYLTITNIKAADVTPPVGGNGNSNGNNGNNGNNAKVDQALADLFEKRLTATYSNTLSTLLPAKLTVSTLKPSLLTDAIEESERMLENYTVKNEEEETAEVTEQNGNGEFEINESELPQTDITKAETEKKEEEPKTSKTPLKVPLFMIGALSESYRSRLAKLSESEDVEKAEKKLRPHLLTKKTEADRSTADPAEIGTATHLFMQFCDFENVETNGVQAEIERLKKNQFILPYHAALMDTDKLEAFFRSAIYKEMKTSGKPRREVRFNIRMPAEQFAPAEKADKVKDETLLVQGVIDCYYKTADGKTVLLDYKTDSFPADMPKKQIAAILRKRHANQLYYYKQALERLLLRPVDKVVVYSFALGDSISLRFPKNGKAPYSK